MRMTLMVNNKSHYHEVNDVYPVYGKQIEIIYKVYYMNKTFILYASTKVYKCIEVYISNTKSKLSLY